MPELYFTDLAALALPVTVDDVEVRLSKSEITSAQDLGLVDGMPFILGSDGTYDHDLNRFFRSCPTIGVLSPNSWRAYAHDILIWMRFLSERRGGKSVWAADRNDIAAFHKARRLSEPPHRITASSWNRSIAALDKLYRWAVEEKLIGQTPFTYRQMWARSTNGTSFGVSANIAREKAARKSKTRFLSLDRYLAFRDVGLRGRLPDGNEDPTWRGRNGERNALFAELLVTTGLRLQEASSLLSVELPVPKDNGEHRLIAFGLASATGKGSKGREVRLPARLIKQLRDYVLIERSNSLSRLQQRRTIERIERKLFVVDHDRNSIQLVDASGTTRVRVDSLKPDERRRLIWSETMDPVALWLTEGGLPMPVSAWQAVFTRACDRCRRFGLDIDVTPHVLRHTFAVHMLALLLKEQTAWLREDRSNCLHPAYRRLIGDPLLKLQRLMGHSRIESTYIYLDHLDEYQVLIDSAIDQWGLEVVQVGQVK